jgi:hypothetical protein
MMKERPMTHAVMTKPPPIAATPLGHSGIRVFGVDSPFIIRHSSFAKRSPFRV